MEIIVAALIAGAAGVWAAYLNNRRGKATLQELRPNGGASMRDLLDRVAAQVMVIHDEQAAVKAELVEFRTVTAHDKAASKEEAVRMWRAIEAVAKADPPV